LAKTPTEMIAEFGPAIATVGQRVDSVEKSIDALAGRQASAGELLAEAKREMAVIREQLTQLKADLGPDLKVNIGILQRDVAELRKTKEQWTQRAWNLLGPLVGAAAGATLTYLLRK
jgi:hypothetical protein